MAKSIIQLPTSHSLLTHTHTWSALRSRLCPEIGSTCLLCPYLNCLWSHTTFYISMLFTAEDTQSTLNVSSATECGELKGKKRHVETGVVCILMLEVYVHTKLCTDCFTVSHPNITRPWLLLPPVHFIVVTLNNPSNNMDQDTVFPITCLVNQPRHVCSLKLTQFCTGATRVVDNS